MFIDIVGFTPLTEQRDSEEVRAMLTRYFDRARQIVERFGGVIDKYIGDAVMAVWGAHIAHEDDAERAVRAALELVDAVAALGQTEGMPGLAARAGVLTGEAAVGGDGNAVTGLIIGDTVNTASRLQSAAEPGQVLVGRSTRDLAAEAIEFELVGPLALKGKAAPEEAHRAVRVTGGHRGARRSEGLVPPFVGRNDELRLLKDNLHAVERDGRLRMVSIVGQGGIGKSRLVDELWKYVDGLTETFYWHHGRSPAYGEELSFWAVAEMVRQRCGIVEGADDHVTRTRLRTALAEFVPDQDDRAWLEPHLESLLGLNADSSADRAELFAAWRMFFTDIADQGPVVLVFEDAHWADDGTLDFIDEMVSLTASPLLVVTLGRPELLERRPGWGSGRSNSIGAHLAPLAPATMRELVVGVVSAAPESLVERLVEHAGGIPLYAVELLRMLAADGTIRPVEEGHFVVDGDVSDISIPDSLHGLVGARLDQFDRDERSLIADAAILGQSFSIEGLAALRDGVPSQTLASQLEPLVRREVLAVNRDPRSPERGQYRFVQSIIREVAHERISRADRHERHIRVARYFDSLGLPEVAGVTASHYLDALEAAPSGEDVADLRKMAIDALLSAADRAGAMQSHAQVVNLCLRGIDLAESPDERGELLIRAARAAHAGLDENAERYAGEAIDSFAEAGDATGRLRAGTTLARILNDAGRANESWELLEPLVAAAGDTAGSEGVAQLARSFMLDGHTDRALEWCDRALAQAEEEDNIPVFVDSIITKGTGLALIRRTREAVILLEAGLEMAREHQLMAQKRRVLQNLSYVSASDSVEREDLALERLEDARRLGDPRNLTEVQIEWAWSRFLAFDWEETDRIISGIDPTTLPLHIETAYWNVAHMRSMWAENPAAALAERAALNDRLAGSGDTQALATLAARRADDALIQKRFRDVYEIGRTELPPVPLRLDLWFRMLGSVLLSDRTCLAEALEAAESNPFRGRMADLFKHALRAALASSDGEPARAEADWRRTHELAMECAPVAIQAMMLALAGHSLGSSNPYGLESGRRAYELLSDRGANTLLEVLSTGVFEPEDRAADTA
jgi:class 3 adenylate cyclase/tetratricopeptide (TPR) repeat protein